MHHTRKRELVQGVVITGLALAMSTGIALAAPAPQTVVEPTPPNSLVYAPHHSVSTLLEEMGTWYKLSYSDKAGFISANWLDVSTSGDEEPLGVGTVTAQAPTVRASTSTTAPALGTLEEGDTVSILDNSTPGWYKISFINGVGYIGVQYIEATIEREEKPSAPTLGEQAVALAQEQLGKPYVYGASGPNSFDCSGLMRYIYQQLGVTIARSSSSQFNTSGTAVPLDALQPGDLVFFYDPQYDSTGGRRSATHVGIYAGDNTFIHASTNGDVVRSEKLFGGYHGKYVVGAKRIG